MWVCGAQREISVAHTVKCPDNLQLRVDPIFPAWVKFSQWGTGGDTEDFVIESCQDVHGWHNNKLSLSLSLFLSLLTLNTEIQDVLQLQGRFKLRWNDRLTI